MIEIPVGKRHITIVDDDYEYLNEFSWYLSKGRNTYYAYRTALNTEDGNWVQMHRFIMELTPNDKILVDHINRNGLDNKKSNLRLVTNFQNMQNREIQKNKIKSKYRGVFPHHRGKWYGQVQVNGKKYGTGVRETELEAHEAVKLLRLELMSHAID